MPRLRRSNITKEDLMKHEGKTSSEVAAILNVCVRLVESKRAEFGLSNPRSSSSIKSNKVSTSGLSSSAASINFPNKKSQSQLDASCLQNFLENLVINSKEPWKYTIYWQASTRKNSLVLNWRNGYLMGENESMKMMLPDAEQQHRQSVIQLLTAFGSQLLGNEDATDTAWFFLKSMTKEHHDNAKGSLSNVVLGGNGYVWIAGRRLLSTSDYTRAREGAHDQLKTMVFISIPNEGVVELGSTKLILENADLIKHVRLLLDSTFDCFKTHAAYSPTKKHKYEESERAQRLNFKVSYGGYKHKFYVSVSEATLACVMEKVGVLCNLTIGTFMLTYLDEERDTILLQTELAMEVLVENMIERNVVQVELEVVLKQNP